MTSRFFITYLDIEREKIDQVQKQNKKRFHSIVEIVRRVYQSTDVHVMLLYSKFKLFFCIIYDEDLHVNEN